MTWQWWSIIPVWILALVGAVLVGTLTTGTDFYAWLPIVLAACVITTFVIQLAIQRTEGFVYRTMTSVAISVVILGLATGALALSAQYGAG
jgi:hypothetical protein